MMKRKRGSAGLTMIELMVVVGIIALLVVVAAPSFKRFIDVQRLRGINAQLITDIQFARAEAASRNTNVVVMFDSSGTSVTCYTLLTGDQSSCDCKRSTGVCAASDTGTHEIRTVQVPRDSSITVSVPTSQSSALRFSAATGRTQTLASDFFTDTDVPFEVDVIHPDVGGFRNEIKVTGRPSTCSPSGQVSGVAAC